MHITELDDANVTLSMPTFSCDNSFGKHIPTNLPNQHFAWCFSGKAGSGKTSLCMSLLCGKGDARVYRKVFEHVHLIAPSHSLASMKQNYFKNHPKHRIHNTLNSDILEGIKESAKELREEDGGDTLIVIDDMAVHLKNKHVIKELGDIIANRRHYGISLIILIQSYLFLPLIVRKQLTHLCMWKPTNKKEMESVFGELIYLDKDSCNNLHKYVFQDKYDFLYLDINSDQPFHRNFNTLQITDGDEEEN
jgi:hypothetical protein